MLRRKMYDILADWKENGTKPLLIYGQRQIGKTFIVENFAKDRWSGCLGAFPTIWSIPSISYFTGS